MPNLAKTWGELAQRAPLSDYAHALGLSLAPRLARAGRAALPAALARALLGVGRADGLAEVALVLRGVDDRAAASLAREALQVAARTPRAQDLPRVLWLLGFDGRAYPAVRAAAHRDRGPTGAALEAVLAAAMRDAGLDPGPHLERPRRQAAPLLAPDGRGLTQAHLLGEEQVLLAELARAEAQGAPPWLEAALDAALAARDGFGLEALVRACRELGAGALLEARRDRLPAPPAPPAPPDAAPPDPGALETYSSQYAEGLITDHEWTVLRLAWIEQAERAGQAEAGRAELARLDAEARAPIDAALEGCAARASSGQPPALGEGWPARPAEAVLAKARGEVQAAPVGRPPLSPTRRLLQAAAAPETPPAEAGELLALARSRLGDWHRPGLVAAELRALLRLGRLEEALTLHREQPPSRDAAALGTDLALALLAAGRAAEAEAVAAGALEAAASMEDLRDLLPAVLALAPGEAAALARAAEAGRRALRELEVG